MNKKLGVLVIFSIAVAMIGSALAQTPAPSKPVAGLSVDEIIKKYVEATGGKAARDKITTRVEKGTFEIPAQGVSGTIEVYSKFPDKSISIIKIEGVGEIRNAYNGKIAWADDPFSGLREKSGSELALAKRGADSDAVANWKKFYAKAEVTGSEKVGDADAYVVKFTDADGKTSSQYFDKKTFYLIRDDETLESPQGTFPAIGYTSDFREVDGLKLPFEAKQEIAGATYVVKFTEIKQNVPIEDSKFEKPSK